LKNQTVRMILRASIGGSRVRVRLFNALGANTVTIGSAHIGIRANGSAVGPGTDRTLTFSGAPGAKIFAGQVLISDPVQLQVKALADLAVSLYLPEETGAPTSHTFGLRPAYVSKEGDFTAATEVAEVASTMESYYWVAGVDVIAPPGAGTLVTFGDSITDGDQSTPDTNGMWPALLSARLQGTPRTSHVGVVNAGISGNRILGDNNSGLARLVSHALSVPGVKWLTLLEGINDITAATRPGVAPQVPFSADDLIAAYRQVIEMAHVDGVKVIGCTLTPYGGSNVYTESGEAIRQKANNWIRTSGAFDAVVDFDAATRDAGRPSQFRQEADSPDMLHPGDAGYKLMAEAFDLAVFDRGRSARSGR
jgi:lysophospholipase L1-like esterase